MVEAHGKLAPSFLGHSEAGLGGRWGKPVFMAYRGGGGGGGPSPEQQEEVPGLVDPVFPPRPPAYKVVPLTLGQGPSAVVFSGNAPHPPPQSVFFSSYWHFERLCWVSRYERQLLSRGVPWEQGLVWNLSRWQVRVTLVCTVRSVMSGHLSVSWSRDDVPVAELTSTFLWAVLQPQTPPSVYGYSTLLFFFLQLVETGFYSLGAVVNTATVNVVQ